jgi:hypothetical protein
VRRRRNTAGYDAAAGNAAPRLLARRSAPRSTLQDGAAPAAAVARRRGACDRAAALHHSELRPRPGGAVRRVARAAQRAGIDAVTTVAAASSRDRRFSQRYQDGCSATVPAAEVARRRSPTKRLHLLQAHTTDDAPRPRPSAAVSGRCAAGGAREDRRCCNETPLRPGPQLSARCARGGPRRDRRRCQRDTTLRDHAV